ncbi:hypothetical protein KAK07_17465 [Ideonella sp. 4Y16]|uniref:Lipoprotein n=1 Tax=Ideonella alba TaxID=2824118 RepID=A0A940Y7G0_9BURK|nr:hypothetical protein [Ideonella alba]MBQ0931282.1 hypothetical protein [Ideonella alba]MBQ0945130.1 hypothetical protein [Ideonella alba]
MRHTSPRFRTALATAALLIASAPAAQAGGCKAFANQRYVFLLQGQVRSADGLSDVGKSILGRLVFDATGAAGSFTLMNNGGDPVSQGQEQGSFSCLSTRQLSGLAQQLNLSNGLAMLAVRERGAVQLLAQLPNTAMNGEARPAALWDTLPQGACDLLPGKAYIGRYGAEADGVAAMGLAQWRFDTRVPSMQTWTAYSTAAGAVAQDRSLSPCTPTVPDQAAVLTVNEGVDGYLMAYPSADGSVAWIHTFAGRGVGGWMRPR